MDNNSRFFGTDNNNIIVNNIFDKLIKDVISKCKETIKITTDLSIVDANDMNNNYIYDNFDFYNEINESLKQQTYLIKNTINTPNTELFRLIYKLNPRLNSNKQSNEYNLNSYNFKNNEINEMLNNFYIIIEVNIFPNTIVLNDAFVKYNDLLNNSYMRIKNQYNMQNENFKLKLYKKQLNDKYVFVFVLMAPNN